MTHADDMPTPYALERDVDGRLVSVSFSSLAPSPGSGEPNPWLIALDGSSNAQRAIAFAAEQARWMQRIGLHLIHVVHWLAKEAAEAELAARGWHTSAAARATLAAAGLPWCLHVRMGEAAPVILACADTLEARVIVLGHRGQNALERLLLGSVAEKVLHQARRPVLLVP